MSARHATTATAPSGFLPLLITRLTSVAAAGIYFIATSWLLIDQGGRSTEVAGLAIGMTVPSIFAALYGGVVIDRYNRRRIGQCAELVRALAVLCLAIYHTMGPPSLWQLYAVTCVLGLGNALTLPCYGAMLPQVLPREKLVKGNAIWQIATQVGGIAASALGGLLVGKGGVETGLLTTAVCYLTAAAALQLVPAATSGGTPVAGKTGGWRHDLVVAVRVVSDSRTHLLIAVFSILPPSVLAASNTLLPVFAKERLGAGATGFGVLEGIWGGGALLAGVLISRTAGRMRSELRALVVSLLATGVTMLAFSFITEMGLSLPASMLLGFTLSCSGILFPAYVQSKTPDAVLGRVLSSIQFASAVVQLVFAAAIGIGGAFVPAWPMFSAMALLLVGSAVLLALLLRAPAPGVEPVRPDAAARTPLSVDRRKDG
ncbi:MFS transporter [Streptomyces sp. NPDC059894]|uniref:MFS transporter n=1 Tax=unclassified Streptomyces TaxID=2593676 RepID=UPI00365293F3